MKPCEETCCKCGSDDVYRTHYKKGEEVQRPFSSRVFGPSDDYVDRGTATWVAKQEHIAHHCRSCQYEWRGPILKEKTCVRKPRKPSPKAPRMPVHKF